MTTEELFLDQDSEKIIGAAMKVLNTLRPGLDEKAYENALAIELRNRAHQVDQQKRFNVLYEGHVVDTLVPDLIVDELIIVDPKVTEAFTSTHIAQMLGYLPSPTYASLPCSISNIRICAGAGWFGD